MNNETSLQTALEQHQAGKLDEAERVYREILRREPENADVLHFLGILLFQKKDHDSAVEMIKKAIQINPGNENAYYNLAGVLQDIGELDEAITYYQKVIEINPDIADTYNSLGAVLQKKGRLDEAITYYRKALQMNPDLAVTQLNLGYALQQKGQLDEAITCYQKAIEIKPDFDDAHYNLGVIFQAQGRLDEALVNYYRTMHHNPDKIDVHNNVGIILKAKGQLDGAVASFRNAIGINPNIAEIWNNLGNALHDKGEISEAVKAYEGALKLNPDLFQTHYDLGNSLKEEGKTEEAISAYDRALELKPDLFKASWARCMALLPTIYLQKHDIEKTRDRYYEEFLKLRERLSLQTPESINAAAEAVGSQQPFYLAAQGLNDRDLQKMYGETVCRIMSAKYPQWAERPAMPPVASGEPLRIGIISGHFFHHSIWKIPLRGWIDNIDKNRFSLYGYYTGTIKDHVTAYARQTCSRFVEDIKSFKELCQTIREDNLHILIFPEIGMDPITLRLASLRLAPIQCTTLGHPDTSGLPTIDYYLSSDLMEPPDADNHYSERLIRLPNVAFSYVPLDVQPADVTRETFGLRKDSILYLCSHAVFTHLPQYDEIYARIARQIDNSQFIFIEHYTKHVTDRFRARLFEAFNRLNLDADKHIVFLHELPQEEYLSINSLSHIFLDTPGWSGNNSTFEAIACNLPIVTLPGALMRQRHCYGILTFMGITETITQTIDEYVALAVRLGQDSEYRLQLSEKIAANRNHIYRDRNCIITFQDFVERMAHNHK
jgi:predicted O-linked N-acetylglucosamine transferase (SPINDLY family)